ncbi:MAG: outer membrane protein assembly factor BamE [Pseudomonadota bacterium]
MGIGGTSGIAVIFAALLLAGCTEKVTVHGYAPTPEQISQIEPGVDTIFSLESRIGRPSTSGLLRDGAWYYVQTTQSQLTYNAPRITDRRVVAVDYDADGVVTQVQVYGLDDGRLVNLSPRVTETSSTRRSILAQLFGNVFNVDAEGILGGQ